MTQPPDRMFRTLLAAAAIFLAWTGMAAAEPVTVFAAASLTDAMGDVSAAWVRAGHEALRNSFASSSTLARQIEAGAPAELFASADEKWMDELAHADLLAPGTRADLLANDLVLVVPKGRADTVALDHLDFDALLGPGGRLAVGDPAHVPAGLYAKQALTHLGVWAQAEPRLAAAEDVRAALRLVDRGECLAGIVYATDARADPAVTVAAVFPEASHEPIVYPFAILRGHDSVEAAALMAFLRGAEATAIFRARGFR